jgi:transcriptional regulator with XRE-family HTH domain
MTVVILRETKRRLGQRIRVYRRMRHLSQAELAYLIRDSRQAIVKYETGRAAPQLTRIPALCEALNISLSDLLDLSSRNAARRRPVPRRGSTDRCRSDRHGAIYDSQRKG